MPGKRRALGRIALLTEVWECLATDPESRSDEVGFFCAKAMTQLARSEGPGDNGKDGIVDWILEHSSSTWGEYLALLEGQDRDEGDRETQLEGHDGGLDELSDQPEEFTGSLKAEADADASLQIDAQALAAAFPGWPSRRRGRCAWLESAAGRSDQAASRPGSD